MISRFSRTACGLPGRLMIKDRQRTPAAARESYVARFNAFMEAHRELFRSLEMTHCLVRTDENPWRALALFLAERKRLK